MAETGRAAVMVAPGAPFEIRSFPLPDPGPRDMVVAVRRANVCGSDLHIHRGEAGLVERGVTWPLVLGHEMVGTVARLGAKVRGDALGHRLREGDRVIYTYAFSCGACRACLRGRPHVCPQAMAPLVRPCEMAPHFVGGFADYYYLKGRQAVFRVPDALDDTLAAGVNCALSQVVHGFDEARLTLGDTVAVQGAGGLGLYACAVAREMGADRIVAIDGVPERLELARAFGADTTIDMSEITDPRARVQAVLAATDGWGADVVVEVAGVPEAVPEGIRMVARGGRYLEIGNISPRRTYKADPSLLVGFNRSLIAVSLYPPDVLRRAIAFLERARDRYPFERLVPRDFALGDIDAAFAAAGTHACPRASIVPGAAA